MTTRVSLAIAGAVLMLGCTQSVESARSIVSGERSLVGQSTSRIWVLDDADPDYSTPPFGDTLTLLDEMGVAQSAWSDLNVCQTIGGWRAVDARSGYALVAEIAGDRLLRFDAGSSAPSWAIDGSYYAVDIVSDALAFVIRSDGHLGGVSSVVAVDPGTGLLLAEYPYGGVDLVADPARSAVWIVGAGLYKLGFDGTVILSGPAFGWSAVSLDLRSDGSIWVVERQYQPGWGADRLLHFGADGAVLTSVDLAHFPFAVAVDRSDDSAWVAAFDGTLMKFDAAGAPLLEIATPGGSLSSVALDPSDGSVWVGGRHEFIYHYSSAGTLLQQVGGFAAEQKFMATSLVEEAPPVIQPGDFRTYGQGGWGAACHGANPGCRRDAGFATVFPGGLRVGEGHFIELGSSLAVEAFLPQGRRPAALTQDHVDPLETEAGVLAGQLVAAVLNAGFDRSIPDFGASARLLSDLRVVDPSSPCQGWSVAQVILEGHRVIGGSVGALSAADVNGCLAGINEAFPDGGAPSGFLGY